MILQVEAVVNKGQFGNRLVTYLVACYHAKRLNAQLRTLPWIGECMFQINDQRITAPAPAATKDDLLEGFNGARTVNAFYELDSELVVPAISRSHAQEVLVWQNNWLPDSMPILDVAIHRRRYRGESWPHLSIEHQLSEAESLGFKREHCTLVGERPVAPRYPWPFKFVDDFQLLLRSKVLFVYPSSTFSMVAALLGHGRVFSAGGVGPGVDNRSYVEVDPSSSFPF